MDLYELLGLARGATPTEVKRSYRRLARKFHPDLNPGDSAAEARFKEIMSAYETLSDPDRRLRYDAAGVVESTTVTFGFEGFDFSARGIHPGAPTFGDLFAEMFTQRDSGAAAGRGVDLHSTISLTFEEAMQGAQRELTVTRRAACHSCGGAGAIRVTESPCRVCEGSGVIRSHRGHMVFAKSCGACGGTGRAATTTCGTCAGSGAETRSESVVVRAPAGVRDGSRIRVPGKGHTGVRNGGAGDLYITVQVQPHDTFVREGNDFHVLVPVAVHEAALGARVDVPAPDGSAKVRVPPAPSPDSGFA